MKILWVKILLILCIVSIQVNSVFSQTSVNNEYISDYSHLLALKTYLLIKANSVAIINNKDRITLVPNSPLGIGAGFNFKGIGLALGIGLPHSTESITKYGRTDRFDMQASLYSSHLGGDAYFQYYKGYYNANPGDFVNWDKEYLPQIPAMQTISFGANLYYVFNNKKFSNKAAYSRTQVQLKSAGSFVLGYFLNYDEVQSSNGFVPKEFPDSIAMDFDIRSFRYFATGISVGYMYTWVITDHFFFNGSFIPGVGYKDILLNTLEGEKDIERKPHAQLLLRGALGYETRYFYMGLSGLSLIRNIQYKDYDINIATGQLRIFIGKRFRIKK